MRRAPSPIRWSPRASSRALLFAAMAGPAWRIGAMLPGFFDVTRDVPIAAGGPSLWAIVGSMVPDRIELSGLALATVIGTFAALLAQFVLTPPRREQAVAAALLAALALPWLLPATALIDVAPALLLAVADTHRRRTAELAGWTAAGLLAAILGLPALGGVAIGVAIWRTARIAIVLPANDNALPLPAPRLYLPRRAA
ncbi:MAG: hypothetical protein J0I47_01880 [Sphingomonas sp.]|uniref:hypothetical protein n=1 Tax=Sphingomonas sp. TaxID=28214 RepID=UPI001AC1F7DA|nr:hypothetical protein [Sphingomonas sp.]MBN8806978.1 hypothetical protein [Sphingomonas sp.]